MSRPPQSTYTSSIHNSTFENPAVSSSTSNFKFPSWKFNLPGVARNAKAPFSMADRTHTFISHRQFSGGDQALLVREELASRGLAAWYDQDREPTATGMRLGVEGSACVVVLLSRGYLPSPAVQLELRTTVELKKPIIFLIEADG